MKPTYAALLIALALVGQPATAAEWGKDYAEVPAQPTGLKRGQVEVLEFFWYGCPHCYHLEPELAPWLKKLPKKVVFKRVPAVLNEAWMPLARGYYALEALGLQKKLHAALFHAVQEEGRDLNPPGAFLDWAASQGVNRAKLAAAYDSFGVETQVMRARRLSEEFKLNGVPAFVVAGKYTTSASLTGSNVQTFRVMDELIAQESRK